MSATGPGQSPQLLMDVATILNSYGIDYAVIGALAVAVHGVVRASMDADAVVAATVPQLGMLQPKFVESGFTVEQRQGGIDDPIAAMMLVTDRFGNRVDLLVGLRGLEGSAFERSLVLNVPGLGAPIKVIGREDLIAMKLAAGSPKDLLDAERCVAVAGATLDVELVRRLAKRFGRDAVEFCDKLLPIKK